MAMILPLTVDSLAQAESVGQLLGSKTSTRKKLKFEFNLFLLQMALTAC